MIQVMLTGLAAILVYMSVQWVFSLILKNASIVDIFWGPGFALAAWVYYFSTPDGFSTRKLLIVVLVTIWGLRLGWHIGRRNVGHGEDYRYAAWRKQYGAVWWWRSYLQVFLLQGILMWIISTPLMLAQFQAEPAALTVLDVLGVVIWLIGFVFEAGGDWQLTQFKANPANKGKVMRTGFWRLTRHPNYFGDAFLWWGYFVIALSVPGGFLTVFAPALMTLMLMRVSGVALLEKNLTKTKPEYADYIASTNAFFPGWPRK
jgi:steroid 5-alpha reductase family enzyme